ncbi:MAG: carboxypeptidase regulatory-like domain-containing protein, partial [Bryobacteraceae bacterium]
MSTSTIRTSLGLLAVFACLHAQVERASIVGTVTDKSGALVPGAAVRVTAESTNTTIEVSTGDSGNYSAPNLVPGSYTVTTSKAGFSRAVVRGFLVQVGQAARLDITMDVGSVDVALEVTGAAPLLQTEDSSVGQVIAPEPIAALPLNGRNFVQLAILAPGVSGLDYAQPGTINTGRRPDELRPGGTALQANGVRSYLNQVLIDGIDATEMISQTFVVRPAIEGVQEFKVLTNNAGAEYGRGAGAVINITTKSGGNNFHGSVFEFLRNSALDAKNYFDRADQKIPPFRLNQFGGAIGGRVRRDRTFFFTDYEGYREVVGQTRLVTV